jgi:hypothetical protein
MKSLKKYFGNIASTSVPLKRDGVVKDESEIYFIDVL